MARVRSDAAAAGAAAEAEAVAVEDVLVGENVGDNLTMIFAIETQGRGQTTARMEQARVGMGGGRGGGLNRRMRRRSHEVLGW